MMEKLLCLGIAIVLLVVGGFIGFYKHKNLVSRDMRSLTYYRSTYLSKTGWSDGYGSYQLRSFDGGQNWYAVDIDMEKSSVTIKGVAEEVFPGLLSHLDGWDRLTKYVEENGPITFSGERADEDLSVLRGAGFEVETE